MDNVMHLLDRHRIFVIIHQNTKHMVCGGGDQYNMRMALSTTTSLVQYIAIPTGSIPTCILQEETSYLSVVYGFMIIYHHK